MRKFFKDLTKDEQDRLYELYLPLFQKISPLSYKELYDDIINTLPFKLSESSIRNNLQARYKFSQKKINEVDELSIYQNKLEYETHKLRRDKLIFNKEKRDIYDNKLLNESLVQSLAHINVDTYPPCNKVFTSNGEMTVFLSDLHIGKYDKDVHEDILNEVFNNIVFEAQRYERSVVNLYIVGDTVDGLLRISQLQQIKAGMVDQVHIANELLSNFIITLHQNFKSVSVNFIDNDNHGELRPLGTSRNEFPNENLSRFISKYLEQLCSNLDIVYEYGDELYFKEYIVLHGHQFRSHNAVMNYYDKSIIGHWHNYKNIDANHITLPALVYGDEYTKSLGIRDSVPEFVIAVEGAFKKIILED